MNELELSTAIEALLVERNPRHMQVARAALEPGYYLRAARQLRDIRGPVIIGTGFPVTTTFETDGPVAPSPCTTACTHWEPSQSLPAAHP